MVDLLVLAHGGFRAFRSPVREAAVRASHGDDNLAAALPVQQVADGGGAIVQRAPPRSPTGLARRCTETESPMPQPG